METKLKTARVKAGISQEAIARKVGLTVPGYQNYEHGKRIPRADMAANLASILGTTVETLWGSKAPPRDPLPES